MLSTGIDIVGLNRLHRVLARDSGEFSRKVFTVKEILNSKRYICKTGYFSRIFAFKESFVKAMGCGFISSVKPIDIELILPGNLKTFKISPRNIHAFFKNKAIDIVDIRFFEIKDNMVCNLVVNL